MHHRLFVAGQIEPKRRGPVQQRFAEPRDVAMSEYAEDATFDL
jgi:hypothetical protein